MTTTLISSLNQNLKFCELIRLNNYSYEYRSKVKTILIVSINLIFMLFVTILGTLIAALVLLEPLLLISLLVSFLLIGVILTISFVLLKRNYLSSITSKACPPLSSIKSFSIKKQASDQLNVEILFQNNILKTIIFFGKSASKIFSKIPCHLELNNQAHSYNPLTGYVCRTNKIGSPNHSPEGKIAFKKFQTTWKKNVHNHPFNLGEVRVTPIFLKEIIPSISNTRNENLSILSSTIHSYLILTHTHSAAAFNTSQFLRDLKASYKHIFALAKAKKIKALHLPVLGINELVLEPKKISQKRELIASKIFLQCLLKEISKPSSIQQLVIFTDDNSIIKKFLMKICNKIVKTNVQSKKFQD